MEKKIESGYVPVESGSLYYEVVGNGPALLLIHAGVADSRMWDEQFEAFAEQFRVIRYDTRGYGKTTTQDGSSFSNRQDILDLLNHLGIEKTYLSGCSRGGQIATDFTLEFPERVAALIPVAAGVGGYAEDVDISDEEPFNIKAEELEKLGDWEGLAELDAQLWADGCYRNGKAPANVRDKVRQMCLDNYRRQDGQGQPRVLQPPAYGRLSEIKVPTLVIYGDIDTIASVVLSNYLANNIEDAKKVVFPGVAHMVNMEKPDEFNRLVINFLTGLENSK
jgi:pimeloyl-ACP methyl ester carboxylesterase